MDLHLDPCPQCGEPDDRPHAEHCPDAPDAVPWAIPIREPGPDIPQREASWVDRAAAASLPPSLLVTGALVVFLLLAAVVVTLGDNGSTSDPEVAGSEITAAPTTTVAEASAPSADASTTTAPATTAAPPTTSTTAPTATTTEAPPEAAPQQATANASEPADLPYLTPGDYGGGWVAQVSSVPASAGGSALTTAFETVSADMGGAAIVRGSEWGSLQAGYWVIIVPGFESGTAAVDACVAGGKPDRSDCFGRHLEVSSDVERVCYRDENGTLVGDC